MIKPNWEIFKVKFSENPQNNFEWFCYLLFCKEFNRPFGIFRYKNQAAIETDPIEIDDNLIGWQAKFYDSSLSNHNDEILNTIDKVKRDYPNINKLIFYTNQEWGQNKGNKPQGFLNVEERGASLSISIEWRTASYFESEFVSIKNEVIAKHFFTLEKSAYSLIENISKHSKNILNEIQTFVSLNNNNYEINRSQQLDKLKNSSSQVLILSGAGGVGKTSLIKKLYKQIDEQIPFYIFKATEFELRNVNDLFPNIGLNDFIKAHEDVLNKIIVVDSSEKLLDLNNSDPFKEFLSVLLREQWKIIFTTRISYLEDLNYQFFEVYKIVPENITVSNLELTELQSIAKELSFILPKDEKILDLIKTPFYLSEYLKYHNTREEIEYNEFKVKLWNKNIKKSKPERELCFLKIAFEKAKNGQFYINSNYESTVLMNELVEDGILAYEAANYFITHDIYEEWALEKIIESEFVRKEGTKNFFNSIGQSLPIRRSFRSWLSEKLSFENEDIKKFIVDAIENQKVESHWKDEIFVSVLLSSYADLFFEFFKKELLLEDQKLLKRIIFILRLACKDIDDVSLSQLGHRDLNIFSLNFVLTKPKGQGWESVIKFLFKNIEIIGISNITYFLPIIYDWNYNVRMGETTRAAALIALEHYQWAFHVNHYFSNDGEQEQILKTILYGSSEIKNELLNIFEEVIKNKWIKHRDPYYELSKMILNKLEGVLIVKISPASVLGLANIFWTHVPKKNPRYYHSGEIEQFFGLDVRHSEYHPASAFQTPTYWLLQYSFKETIDFILQFTNRSIDYYANSDFDSSVQKVEVIVGETKKEQFISHCLWNMYRGTGSPVSPYLLQSLHMALEKYLLEIGEVLNAETLEIWLIYLLRNSISASISAIVTSVVLAYPEKTFDVAKILFQTKEFIIQDTSRFISDQRARSLYSIGTNIGRNVTKFFDDERIATCDDKHRKWRLEDIFLRYQLFKNEATSDEEGDRRRKILWEILDNYYKKLPKKNKESDSDKIWRLFLARMDRRNMGIEAKVVDGNVAILFQPNLESDLQEYSNQSASKNSEHLKYISLRLWAELKFNNDKDYMKYEEYEKDPHAALHKIKEILDKLKSNKPASPYKLEYLEEENFSLMNHATPTYVAVILIKHSFNELSQEDKNFCKDIILEAMRFSLSPDYLYQISDGVEAAISALPNLFEIFPDEIESIKIVLLLSLFNESPIGGLFARGNFSIFSINAINRLWEKHFEDAESFLYGYLLLKPRYNELKKGIHLGNYVEAKDRVRKQFIQENQAELENFLTNKISIKNLEDIEKLNLRTLKIAFQLIPYHVDKEGQKVIATKIISTFARELLLEEDNENRIDYNIKYEFLNAYAYFVLNSDISEIQNYLQPFLDSFIASEIIADLFREFILVEDKLSTNDKFWFIWNMFKEKVIAICKKGMQSNAKKIVKAYLFAEVDWKDTTKEWDSLKDKDKRFFKEISERIGYLPSVLYSISKLLNTIGAPFIDDGIVWISSIIEKNEDNLNKKLESNTIYYIENICRKYAFNNREKIKRTKELKLKLIIILNFLIEKGSAIGYMLRESIA
ncbi:AVAST type 4 anti-phage nuclease Avs4 [Leptospira adleri]|uniref:ATP-binding protein n=1 Tax=Leptospira adleri TaxID=2023186 RepID=A0ABX4NUP0_9LEPT|nr:AVAST type 4 anti-phage nuclease Avs4 [Leptospira adleri]PJZ59586.1 hypothetical protein CH376_22920 [Leptospira adleri]